MRTLALLSILAVTSALLQACGTLGDDCTKSNTCASGGSSNQGGQGGMTTTSSSGGAASGGTGGCMNDSDCTSAAAAKCDMGSCVACDDSAQCAGITGTEVCDAGACVECSLADESACSAGTTCDLLAMTCTGPAAGSVANCNACSNDLQCQSGHRCIAMDFESMPHGSYCLKEATMACARPFQVPINKPSISGAAAVNYCGIEEDLATCEAVLALLQGWVCPSNTDGMCSPDGIMPEQPVPGAVCEQVGVGGDACTYACDQGAQCLTGAPGNTCGTGTNVPPGWCGG